MASYVLIYKGGNASADAAERDTAMAAWGAWFGSLGEAVSDAGNPFGPSAAVATDGTVSAGASSGACGYSILKADTLDAATEMAKGCPHLAVGGEIEVFETFPVM